MGIHRRADIDGERRLPGNDVGGAGHGVDVADGADQPVLVGAAELAGRTGVSVIRISRRLQKSGGSRFADPPHGWR